MYATREEWLGAAVKLFAPSFKQLGHPLPDLLRVSCSFASRRASETDGEFHGASGSKDGHVEILISPRLDSYWPLLGTLAHELCHAAVPRGGHGAAFAFLARKMLLEGRPTHCCEGPAFKQWIADEGWLLSLGCYPHGSLSVSRVPVQSTRLIKVECGICGYVARVTRKWLDKDGAPWCPGVVHAQGMPWRLSAEQ